MASRHREERAAKLRVLADAEALELHTYAKCRNGKVFPKKDRGGLPSRMMDEATDAVALIMDANDMDLRDAAEARERLRLQRAALRELRKLTRHVELSHEIKVIDDREFSYWSRLATDVRNQLAKKKMMAKRRKAWQR